MVKRIRLGSILIISAMVIAVVPATAQPLDEAVNILGAALVDRAMESATTAESPVPAELMDAWVIYSATESSLATDVTGASIERAERDRWQTVRSIEGMADYNDEIRQLLSDELSKSSPDCMKLRHIFEAAYVVPLEDTTLQLVSEFIEATALLESFPEWCTLACMRALSMLSHSYSPTHEDLLVRATTRSFWAASNGSAPATGLSRHQVELLRLTALRALQQVEPIERAIALLRLAREENQEFSTGVTQSEVSVDESRVLSTLRDRVDQLNQLAEYDNQRQ